MPDLLGSIEADEPVLSLDGFDPLLDTQEDFWAELEGILDLPPNPTAVELDNTLRLYISVLSRYHDLYLHTVSEYHHAFSALMHSDLFRYHSERMCDMIITNAESNKNPHTRFVLYNILLLHGTKHHSIFRSHRKWHILLGSLADVITLPVDDLAIMHGQPAIEARLRLPAASLMYEVCRVQKLGLAELSDFDDTFINKLFDMVETTRDQQDETLNYAVIKLIVALNEQFMVSAVPASPSRYSPVKAKQSPLSASYTEKSSIGPVGRHHHRAHSNSVPHGGRGPGPYQLTMQPPMRPDRQGTVALADAGKRGNRILDVLLQRLGSSKTFGENIIFMLNRGDNSADDICMRLLILKILYLLFTTPGTYEYFYTNDLRVLVDVFVRELVDIPEEGESLRHTYLRVLHPLLTNTQLRQHPYKHAQIRLILLSLISNHHITDVNATTKRLVERCLAADWGGEGAGPIRPGHSAFASRSGDGSRPGSEIPGIRIDTGMMDREDALEPTVIPSRPQFANLVGRSHSAESMPTLHKRDLTLLDHQRGPNNDSTTSLNDVAAAFSSPRKIPLHRQETGDSNTSEAGFSVSDSEAATSPTSPRKSHLAYLDRRSDTSDKEWAGFGSPENVSSHFASLSLGISAGAMLEAKYRETEEGSSSSADHGGSTLGVPFGLRHGSGGSASGSDGGMSPVLGTPRSLEGGKRRRPPPPPNRATKPKNGLAGKGQPPWTPQFSAEPAHMSSSETGEGSNMAESPSTSQQPTQQRPAHPGMPRHARQFSAFGSQNLGFAALARALQEAGQGKPGDARHLPHNPIMSPIKGVHAGSADSDDPLACMVGPNAAEAKESVQGSLQSGNDQPANRYRQAVGWETFVA